MGEDKQEIQDRKFFVVEKTGEMIDERSFDESSIIENYFEKKKMRMRIEGKK